MALDLSRKPAGFNTVAKARQFDELKSDLLSQAESVCRHLYPLGRKEGDEWCVGSPFGEKGKSFKINMRKGVACDFNGGEVIAGDMVAVWALARGIKQGEAYDDAAKWLRRQTGGVHSTPPWTPRTTPAEAEAVENAKQELSEIVQRHRTGSLVEDNARPWWRGREPTYQWQYWDKDGALWGTVKRWDDSIHGKDFRQFDAAGNPKMQVGPRPLYNLPGIMKSSGPVVLVEGEKCAQRLANLGHVATTAISGAGAVAKTDWSPLAGRDVIRWADNDAPGEKWLKDTASLLAAAGAKSVRDVVVPADKSPKWDCADATDAEIAELIKGARSAANENVGLHSSASRRRLTILSVADAEKQADTDYLVKGLIEPGSLSVWFGPPGSGKTFLVKHVAYAIAQGRSIFGRRVRQAPTLYIGLEGEGGIRKRVRALKLRFGSEGDFHFSVDAVSLLDRGSLNHVDIDAIVDAVNESGIRFVVIDTLNRAVGGAEENDSSTMGAFISACKDITQRTGAHVAIVHHSSKAGTDNGPRGHSSLEGAADAVVAVNGNGESVVRRATSRKVKDGVDLSLTFTLEMVMLGIDQDGDDITSMVVCETDAPVVKCRTLPKLQEAILKEIENILAAPDIIFEPIQPWSDGPTVHAIKRSFVSTRLVASGTLPSSEKGAVTGAGRTRLFDTLVGAKQAGRLGSNKEWIWRV